MLPARRDDAPPSRVRGWTHSVLFVVLAVGLYLIVRFVMRVVFGMLATILAAGTAAVLAYFVLKALRRK